MPRFLFNDILDGDLEHHVLARQFWVIIRWECDIDITGFTTRHTNNLFFESWDECVAAQCQFIARCRAPWELNAIFESGKVDNDGVTVFCNIVCIAVARAQRKCPSGNNCGHDFFHMFTLL